VVLQDRDELLLDPRGELGLAGRASLLCVPRLKRLVVTGLDEDAALCRWRWHEGSFRFRADPNGRKRARVYEIGDAGSGIRGVGWERLRPPLPMRRTARTSSSPRCNTDGLPRLPPADRAQPEPT